MTGDSDYWQERAERAEAELQRLTPTAEDRLTAEAMIRRAPELTGLLRRYVLREE